MKTAHAKDPEASKMGRKGGSQKSAAKTEAARKNAARPPHAGSRARGRPFVIDPALEQAFCSPATFKFKDVLKDGKIIFPIFSKERFEMALNALRAQANAAGIMLKQLVNGKKQDRTALKAAHIAMRECKPEVDAIMAFVKSGKAGKTVPELKIEDLYNLYAFVEDPFNVLHQQPPVSSSPRSEVEAAEAAGRMYECVDIQRAIENGQFKTLDDVLHGVKARSESIDAELKVWKLARKRV